MKKPNWNPLFLPEGSVRSLIALTLVGVLAYLAVYTVMNGIESVNNIVVGALIGAVGFVVKDYFEARKTNGEETLVEAPPGE
jgi:hypothetical protein